jgi:hypothetical protein
LGEAVAEGRFGEAVGLFAAASQRVFLEIVTLDHLASFKFWLFLYLALCIGSHLAPSTVDYHGGKLGALLLLGLLLALNLLLAAFGVADGWLVSLFAPWLGPALALFLLCAVLCGLNTLLVLGATSLFRPG